MKWLYWAPLIAASLHMFEEFVFPGQFSKWYAKYKPEIKKSITVRFLTVINVLLLLLCYNVGALAPGPIGAAAWLGVTALLAANGAWHLRGVVKTRTYSPGVLTGLLVYLPLLVYGYIYFLQSKQVSIPTAILVIAIGASYQLWSNIFHRFRARTTEP